MTVTSIEPPSDDATTSELPSGPFILSCPYCSWTSLDIGIKFEKHNNITSQLQKIYNPTQRNPLSPIDRSSDDGGIRRPLSPTSGTELPISRSPDTIELFNRLNTFYKTQIVESSDSGPGYGGLTDLNFNSPSSISRLLNLYSSTGKKAGKRQRPQPMREALSLDEGLQVFQPSTDESAMLRMKNEGWASTTSIIQRQFQAHNHDERFESGLRPVATLLRTKRSKRCRACRTLLSRPEPKVSSTRYKIKVLAQNNIPRLAIRPLGSSTTSAAAAAAPPLRPLTPTQLLLTVTNPLFDAIRVTLATPARTAGAAPARVTVLCPAFDVGANTDVWDDALNADASNKPRALLGGYGIGTAPADAPDVRSAEAGKVWERGRNWTAVIVEVVPELLPGSVGAGVVALERKGGAGAEDDDDDEGLQEDELVVEIPVFVRVEYETEAHGAEEKVREREGKEKREVAFWCVLNVGTIVTE